ncbi:F0F1 ATP synthase subunit delta [Alcanivorax sp. HI0083]|jgi:F-type H+-transporting ATPase subunit delta|uniref:F0F1 ATP synthase subunit delta n=1 Tax=unclassified Alcanivorax TaxID=2638842 RepID=UPI0007BA023B|nr:MULTISPECIES: F0F1 ATP synthase subunit delta [unclassified Alcanivorax]KZY29046.1 F0F1 ATP synthase subunit delta [Alcanivorax sp. HI0044]KZZ27651.1 F0F1 ATP synthase subunit delta [Alcanivorax sp. HI0083]PHR68450.1 MAG: F0F1 ATP synthase subunit delta [Alcanivorax sp.]
MAELTTIARPYAKAAFVFAKEHDALEQWEKMLGLAAAVAGDASMRAYLDQPELDDATKVSAFAEVCGDELDESARNFVAQLTQNKRLPLLPIILQLFHELLAEQQQFTDVEMISAFELDDAATDKLVAALKKRLGTEVNVTTSVDQSLIGGVLVRAGDTVIDGSVRGRLNRLAEQLNS